MTTALLQASPWPRIRELWKSASISFQPIGARVGPHLELITDVMSAATDYCQEAPNDVAVTSQ